jgi:acyl-CoA hydrolase
MNLNRVTAREALQFVSSGNRVFIHSAAAAPQALISALVERAPELRNIEIVQLHTEGPAPYTEPQFKDSFRVNAQFVGGNIRNAIQEGRGDYVPVFLSEVPALFRKGILKPDVALITVSPPDKHGFCSLGVSVDVSLAAIESATYVIAQVNKFMPRTHGNGLIHFSRINAMVFEDHPLPESGQKALTETEIKIGNNCAALIEDRSTLQMGIGAIPDAVLAALINHKDLGIHTEMFGDGLIPLIEKGVVTNAFKKLQKGRVVAGFAMGNRKLYDFIDDNPFFEMKDVAYVNDSAVIRQQPKMVAINSAIEVDLTGQVCSDSIGTLQYSGGGGQMDFIRGASLSEGGKPIIALPSVTGKGISRIVPMLKEGAGVVTTRAHVHYLATEHGVADLYGKNLRQRAKLLIEIAHPDHRENLEKAAFERFGTL